jgi:nucleotide-binding universal stress UspA family protein
VEEGEPALVIERACKKHGADLLAMATHGRSGLARVVLGSVATEALLNITVPTLLVRPEVVRPRPEPEREPTGEAPAVPLPWLGG